ESPAVDPQTCDHPAVSTFMYNAMTYQGLEHLLHWVGHGIVPPRAPRIVTGANGVERDEHGNALGGVRTPQLQVPALTFHVPNSGNMLCGLAGHQEPLADDTLVELYGDLEAYER